VPPLGALQRAYQPVLSHQDETPGLWAVQRTPRLWAVGLFLLRHPSQDYPPGPDNPHGNGRGVLDGLNPSYVDGVRTLCAEAATWPAA